MITMREAIVAALRRDPDLVPKLTGSLRERIDDDGKASKVIQAAGALQPIIEEAVSKRPSRLGRLGLKSAHLLASLASEDDSSNKKLAKIARGSTVGIVFVDVADFTRYTAEHGDEAASEMLGELHRIVESKASRAGGECVKHLGDGFLLAFPSASQAVRGACMLRDAVIARREREPSFPVYLRIAVHAGEPLVEGDDLLGHDVNLTARLLDHCKPDGIVVSEAAKELAEKRLKKVHFGRARVVKIKGLASKTKIFPVRSSEEETPRTVLSSLRPG